MMTKVKEKKSFKNRQTESIIIKYYKFNNFTSLFLVKQSKKQILKYCLKNIQEQVTKVNIFMLFF